MPDGWESRHGLNANDAADGARDTDADGYTNVEEYLNGTDPDRLRGLQAAREQREHAL
jgi:hypothetical protein